MRINVEVMEQEAEACRIFLAELCRLRREYPKGHPLWVEAGVLLEYYS